MKSICPIIYCYALASISILFAGCNEIEFKSIWRTQEINIDGKNTEWQSGHYIKDANVVVNVYNDEEYLYLALLSSDRQMPMKVMSGGLTIWFDPDGKGKKKMGIRFPLGMESMGMPPDMNRNDNGMNDGKMKEMDMNMFNEFEILDKDGKVEEKVSMLDKKGIQIKMSKPQEKFLYEMKIPLKYSSEDQYAIGADTSKTISIGFETAELNLGKGGRGPQGGPGGGSPPGGGEEGLGGNDMRPPGGGGMPPGGGGKQGGLGKMESSKPLDLWVNVKLSSKK